MTRLIKYIIITSIFYSMHAHANSAIELLEQDISSHILKLKSDTYFYNYFSVKNNLEDLKKEEYRKLFSSAYILSRSSQFWNMSNHTTKRANAGLGLYLATDPFISSPLATEFSGANFGDIMLEIHFAIDTKYLSLKQDISLSDEAITALITEKVLSKSQIHTLLHGNKISADSFQYMAEPQYVNFRSLMQNILNKYDISLIEYEWLSSLELFCKSHHNTSAMVYIGKNILDKNLLDSTLIFWPQNLKSMGPSREETLVYNRNKKLIKLLSKLKPLEQKSKISKVKMYINEFYENSDELNEVRSKLFNCID